MEETTKLRAFTLSCKTHSSKGLTPPSPKALRARAFTLAEVLLTLAIIGVVAALTIPAVITKATKEQYVAGLKKAFNTLKQVERESIREHGEVENWNWAGRALESYMQSDFDEYIKKYLDVAKDCKLNTTDCFASEYKRLDGGTPIVTGTGMDPAVITSDGMALKYSILSDGVDRVMMFIYVDINGKKGPNTYGRDMFSFVLFKTKTSMGSLRPGGSYSIVAIVPEFIIRTATTQEIINNCNTESSIGSGCAARVLSEGAMNY